MKYLTAVELSKHWGISSRMITIYCKKGRISGAIKKADLWLIPIDAQRPLDKRNATSNGIDIDDNIATNGISSISNIAETDAFDSIYYARDLYKHLGLTRETVRYYEEIGLIEPKRQIENSYREFDNHDITNVLEIDFLKNRGFSPLEIKNLRKQSNPSDTSIALKKKVLEVEQSIYKQQGILERLKETQELYEYARVIDGKFEIREFPLFSVLKVVDNLYDFSNYNDNFFSKLGEKNIWSHIFRAVSFDSSGFKGSKMCIVQKATAEDQDSQIQLLEKGRCIYTAVIIVTDRDYRFLREKLFIEVHKWAKEQGVELKGILYGCDSFRLSGKNVEEGTNQCVTEIWLPIK